jgi:chemotaxis signal transduction protein
MAKLSVAKNAGTSGAMSSVSLEERIPHSADSSSEHYSVLVFEVGGVRYAIGAEHTEGVVDCPRITPLPSQPEGVAGLTSVRGKMTVVMDLGTASLETARRRLILVKGEAQLGLLADRIDGVVALERKKVRPVPRGKDKLTSQEAKFSRLARSYFKSGGGRVPIIDIERLCEE